MIRTTISEVKNGLSAYLRRVKRGESVLILDRQTPVAWLVPVNQGAVVEEDHEAFQVERPTLGLEEEARIARLERAGVVVRRNPESPGDYMRRSPPPLVSANLVEAVLEMRREQESGGYR